jgi:hypothetical protein
MTVSDRHTKWASTGLKYRILSPARTACTSVQVRPRPHRSVAPATGPGASSRSRGLGINHVGLCTHGCWSDSGGAERADMTPAKTRRPPSTSPTPTGSLSSPAESTRVTNGMITNP